MVKHLYSKIAIAIYVLIAIGLCVWGYVVFKDRDGKTNLIPSRTESYTNDSSNDLASSDDLTSDKDADNASQNLPSDLSLPSADNNLPPVSSAGDKSKPVSSTPIIKGDKLANITPEHCANDCQAFKIDLKLFEYCEQACGISPVKNESSCGDQKDLQKDYCLKDLAIVKKDLAKCDEISDANIKQACKSYIQQDAFESLQQENPRTQPSF